MTTNYQSDLAVSYEGSAFAEHTMEVRDLAPALLALGQAFDRANVLLNGDKASISLNIRATHPGSFEVGLFLEQVFDRASDVLSSDFVTSSANIIELVVGVPAVGISLITLIKKLRGKKPSIGDQQPEGVIFEAENVRLRIPNEIARLYSDDPMRDKLEAFVRPLSKEGIDRVVFRQGELELESIHRDEATHFSAELDKYNVTEHIIPRQRLRIASLTFNNEGKWRLSDGANSNWYSIEDAEFSKAIQQGKRFGINDTLICEVLLTQRVDDANILKLEYSVKRVLQHIIPGEQIPLGATDDDTD